MIPQHIIDAYVTRFPHLRHLAARCDDIRSARAFAENACRLEAPNGVSAREIWSLAGVANGGKWE